MENNSVHFDDLIKKAEDFGKTNIELYKHKAIDKSTAVLSYILIYRIIIFGIVLFSIFLSSAIALWLGDILGKLYLGVFIISGLYGGIVLLIYLLREKIRQSICDSIISNIFN